LRRRHGSEVPHGLVIVVMVSDELASDVVGGEALRSGDETAAEAAKCP